MFQRLAAAYFGGAVGALVMAIALWIAGRADLTEIIGVRLAPALTWEWIESLLLGGSLWALGYPFLRQRGLGPRRSGMLLAAFPALAHMFYFLPRAGHGMMGMELGAAMPVVVLAAGALWGYVVARVAARLGT